MKEAFEILRKINYRDNEPEFSIGFIRGTYLDNITKATGNKLIKVIEGQRRSQKIHTGYLSAFFRRNKE